MSLKTTPYGRLGGLRGHSGVYLSHKGFCGTMRGKVMDRIRESPTMSTCVGAGSTGLCKGYRESCVSELRPLAQQFEEQLAVMQS